VVFDLKNSGRALKFQVNKDVLSDAVSFAVRLLPQRTTLPILGGILIEADANALRLSVFDYEVSAQAEIVAKVEDSGRVLVSGRLLSEIASKLPNAPVEFATDGTKVTVSCGSTKFSLLTMPVDEYPTLPEIPAVSGTITGEAFSNAVGQIATAASKDDVTPVLTGVQIEASEKTLSFVATDRYRVALRDSAWSGKSNAAGLIALVPARTLQEVAKTFGNQGDIQISITKSDDREMIAFKANNRSVTSLLLKGNFPPVKSLFPSNTDNYAIVATQDLIDSTRRVSLVLEREAPLRFTFEDGKVSLEASGNETAQASESISAELEGKDIVVSLKPQFLIDGLTGVHSEFVKIAFTNNENPNKPGPVLISSHGAKEKTEADSYRYLLQPNLLVR
jgi:DNA polymerase III subunit beta